MRYKDQPGNSSTGYYRQADFNERLDGAPLRVLSEDQWQFWQQNGYVIVPNAVPKSQVERMIELIWVFENKKADDPTTWYRPPLKEIEMKELAGRPAPLCRL